LTGWIPALEADKVEAAVVTDASSTDWEGRLAYRTAEVVTESTSAWSVLEAGYTTGSGERNTGELTLSISSKMWVQFGLAYRMKSAGSFTQATVTAAVMVRKS
jgi:hypothetical protein